MDTLTAWHMVQFAVAIMTIVMIALTFRHLFAGASAVKLIGDAILVVVLSLSTIVLGIHPPEPANSPAELVRPQR